MKKTMQDSDFINYIVVVAVIAILFSIIGLVVLSQDGKVGHVCPAHLSE